MTSGNLTTMLGQPSWRLAGDLVELYVTERGGHMGPVHFTLGGRTISPYSVAPWAQEDLPPDLPPMLQILRGDFFCLPFGGSNELYKGERHPMHGESANGLWTFVSSDATRLELSMATTIRNGRITKRIYLNPGETVVYTEHELQGFEGPMSLGHHAMITCRSEGLLGFSPFDFAQSFPGEFERVEAGGRYSLSPGAVFRSLNQAPLKEGGTANLGVYPAREGFEDLVLLATSRGQLFGWSSISFPQEGFVWFALRDLRTLANTLLWFSNGGRSYTPWNDRHRKVIGIEDLTSLFHLGLTASAEPNPLSEQGYATALELQPQKPLSVRYVQGVAEIPKGFGAVEEISPEVGKAVLHSGEATAEVKLDWNFLLP